MRISKILAAGVIILSGMAGEVRAQDLLPKDNGIFTYHTAPRYRDSESHPLRVVAYLLHPVGWVAREAIFRPLSSFTSNTEFTRSFFGYREPFDYREPDCFTSDDTAPDCHKMAPLNALAAYQDEPVAESTEGKQLSGERQIYFPDVNFAFNKSTLNDLGKARIRQVAQQLSSVPSIKVVVEGHTDNVGADEYNNKLGEKRAQAVIKELTELGVDVARLSPISYGESKPLFTEDEEWARAANRRVQFSVQGGK